MDSYKEMAVMQRESEAWQVWGKLALRGALRLWCGAAQMTLLKQLQVVDLSSNQYQGPLPDLANISSLQALNLHDNALTSACLRTVTMLLPFAQSCPRLPSRELLGSCMSSAARQGGRLCLHVHAAR